MPSAAFLLRYPPSPSSYAKATEDKGYGGQEAPEDTSPP